MARHLGLGGNVPAMLRTESELSCCSVDSASNLINQSDLAEGTNQAELPYFHARSSQSNPSFLNGGHKRHRWTTAFVGWRVAFCSWLNLLLVSIPISWTLNLTLKNSHGLTFSFCVLALLPLVRLHDLATRDLASRVGGSKAGLLNGSMSNFVEIVVAISALRKCELKVVQSTLIGAMLCKLLLVLGLCFFAGGMRFSEQGFDPTATQVHSSLLSLSVGAVLLPAAYHFTLGSPGDASFETQKQNILHMSHGVSIVLLFIFQLWSHTYLYNDQHNKKSNRLSAVLRGKRAARMTQYPPNLTQASESHIDVYKQANEAFSLDPPRRPYASTPLSSSSDITMHERVDIHLDHVAHIPPKNSTVRLVNGPEGVPMSRKTSYGSSMRSTSSGTSPSILKEPEPESSVTDIPPQKEPQLSWFLTIFLLIIVTGAVAITVDWLVEAMDEVSTTISKEWVGLILLPAVSSVAEIITAVKVSVKDELTLSVSVAVGSTIQTALFVIPFTVILGWVLKKPLSLLMDPFQSMVLYIAVHTMGYVVGDGKSNWLEGVILICLYIIIAVSFWFYPASNIDLTTACRV
ncbi:Vacuolar calcium ion transporter [Psilocybe cubensis]|uniref:Vacuolar calcium ion transporter n=2 Tax=Psilocybe cubensis TaxID=181762 RepID=A0ACB8H086_PSICU|nr:Vacuolar calcium ion transporter [Psilocybe cubensis]KAH9481405.1 Vacuolar calcium ion transporter [Psilocybe cubensis]